MVSNFSFLLVQLLLSGEDGVTGLTVAITATGWGSIFSEIVEAWIVFLTLA